MPCHAPTAQVSLARLRDHASVVSGSASALRRRCLCECPRREMCSCAKQISGTSIAEMQLRAVQTGGRGCLLAVLLMGRSVPRLVVVTGRAAAATASVSQMHRRRRRGHRGLAGRIIALAEFITRNRDSPFLNAWTPAPRVITPSRQDADNRNKYLLTSFLLTIF